MSASAGSASRARSRDSAERSGWGATCAGPVSHPHPIPPPLQGGGGRDERLGCRCRRQCLMLEITDRVRIGPGRERNRGLPGIFSPRIRLTSQSSARGGSPTSPSWQTARNDTGAGASSPRFTRTTICRSCTDLPLAEKIVRGGSEREIGGSEEGGKIGGQRTEIGGRGGSWQQAAGSWQCAKRKGQRAWGEEQRAWR